MRNPSIRFMTHTALCTALMAILAPISIPGLVPISLATLVIYLCASVVGWKKATLAVALYILLGAIGLPIYAEFSAGFDKLVGPTGGYFLGYLLIALSTGFAVERFHNRPVYTVIGMLIGTAACYLVGTLYLAHVQQMGFLPAAAVGVLPFLVGDAIKIAAAATLGYLLRSRLMKAGLLE